MSPWWTIAAFGLWGPIWWVGYKCGYAECYLKCKPLLEAISEWKKTREGCDEPSEKKD